MLFSRNLFAALLAVAAVSVEGSPIEPRQQFLGVAKFCVGYNLEPPCIAYLFSKDRMCPNLLPGFNDSTHSFESNPDMFCIGYE